MSNLQGFESGVDLKELMQKAVELKARADGMLGPPAVQEDCDDDWALYQEELKQERVEKERHLEDPFYKLLRPRSVMALDADALRAEFDTLVDFATERWHGADADSCSRESVLNSFYDELRTYHDFDRYEPTEPNRTSIMDRLEDVGLLPELYEQAYILVAESVQESVVDESSPAGGGSVVWHPRRSPRAQYKPRQQSAPPPPQELAVQLSWI